MSAIVGRGGIKVHILLKEVIRLVEIKIISDINSDMRLVKFSDDLLSQSVWYLYFYYDMVYARQSLSVIASGLNPPFATQVL